MTDISIIKRFTLILSIGILLFSAIGIYSNALGFIIPGGTVLLLIWSGYFLTMPRRPELYTHLLISLFFIYTMVFISLTGGFFSSGLSLLFFIPVAALLLKDKTGFIFYSLITLTGFCFFVFGPGWGPGVVNLNEHRVMFISAVLILYALGLFCIHLKMGKEREEKQISKETLLRVSKDAKNALEVKDRFLANMSHEIRNPMNGIIGMMHILLDSDLDEEQRKHSKIVYNSAQALLSIVNDILDLSKIEAGQLELDIRPFDLDIAVKDIVSLPEVLARQKGIQFSHTIDTDVPKLLKGDIGRIRQIILNLTGNAIKFTQSGSVSLGISLKTDKDSKAVLNFSVDDTGIGIKEETLKELFTPFVQADASITKEYGGTGLGLSISKLMVEKMGGKIGAESIEMVGSTFWFEIPLEKQSSTERILDLNHAPLRQRRILLISDAISPGKSLVSAFKRHDIPYESAHDTPQALEMLSASGKSAFHAVVMEIQESDQYARALGKHLMDDADLCRIKRILVTAVGQKGDAKAFEDLGFSAYLSMPLEGNIIQDCLRAVFSLDQDNTCNGHPIITRFSLAEQKKQSCRILIVEDMETNLLTAKTLINKQGYRTDEARNGEQALEKIASETYDLVLMDCQMPVMDGYEATKQIRAREIDEGSSHLPIIAMTGNAFEKDREKCFKAGMDDFIAKPVEPDVLARVIQFHLVKERGKEEPTPQVISAVKPPVKDLVDHGDMIFDREKLSSRFGDDEELIEAVLESFVQEAPELLEKLITAVNEEDAESVKSCAHALKGSAANVNAEQVKETALALEKLVDSGKLEKGPVLSGRLDKQFKAFVKEAGI